MTRRLGLQVGLLMCLLVALSYISPDKARRASALQIATQEVVQPANGPAYNIITIGNALEHYGGINIRAIKLVANDDSSKAFNDLVQKFLDEQYADFDSAYELSKTETPIAGDTQFLGTYLMIDYKLFAWSNDLLSIRFSHSLGTHGMYRRPEAYPITYSLHAAKPLALTDLFDPASDYQHVIDSQIKQFLDQQPLTAEQKAYAADRYVWNVTPDGLVITMDDPYVDLKPPEMPEIAIPASDLKAFLKEDSPLVQFWKL